MSTQMPRYMHIYMRPSLEIPNARVPTRLMSRALRQTLGPILFWHSGVQESTEIPSLYHSHQPRMAENAMIRRPIMPILKQGLRTLGTRTCR